MKAHKQSHSDQNVRTRRQFLAGGALLGSRLLVPGVASAAADRGASGDDAVLISLTVTAIPKTSSIRSASSATPAAGSSANFRTAC